MQLFDLRDARDRRTYGRLDAAMRLMLAAMRDARGVAGAVDHLLDAITAAARARAALREGRS